MRKLCITIGLVTGLCVSCLLLTSCETDTGQSAASTMGDTYADTIADSLKSIGPAS